MTTYTTARAVSLVLGAVCFSAGDLARRSVIADSSASPHAITAAVRNHPGLWSAAAILSVVAAMLMVPGVLALGRRSRDRGARVTRVGGGPLYLGLLASIGHAVAYYTPFGLYARAHTSTSDLTAIDKASESYPVLVLLIVVFIAGLTLGTIVMFVGLWRAGAVPVWALVAAVVFAVAGATSGVVVGGVGLIAAAAAFWAAASDLRDDGAQQVAHA